MKGYIHRLITIGTPHFGAQLAAAVNLLTNSYAKRANPEILQLYSNTQLDPPTFRL